MNLHRTGQRIVSRMLLNVPSASRLAQYQKCRARDEGPARPQ